MCVKVNTYKGVKDDTGEVMLKKYICILGPSATPEESTLGIDEKFCVFIEEYFFFLLPFDPHTVDTIVQCMVDSEYVILCLLSLGAKTGLLADLLAGIHADTGLEIPLYPCTERLWVEITMNSDF